MNNETDKAPAISDIYSKLAAVQAELHAPKNESGRFGKHRNVEGILEALKPVLKKHELTLILTNEVVELNGRHYVKATAIVFNVAGHNINASAYAWEGDISRGLDAPQVTGAASSYARKYALGGLFAIDDTKDPDSNTDAAPAVNVVVTKAPPAKAAPQKDSDPATPQQKQQLKNMMTALEMEPDAMTLMVNSVLSKDTVDTFGDYKKVVEAMEDTENET